MIIIFSVNIRTLQKFDVWTLLLIVVYCQEALWGLFCLKFLANSVGPDQTAP